MHSVIDGELTLLLRFRDETLERAFWSEYELELRSTVRPAIAISLVSWTFGLVMTWVVLPEQLAHFTLVLLATIYAPFALILATTRGDRLLGWYHALSGVMNLLSGGLLIYFCSFFPHGTDMMLMLLIFIVFVGFYSYRLLLRVGVIVGGLYLLAFQIYIAWLPDLESAHFQILTFITWLTFFFTGFAGYASEKNARLIFMQRRTILRQKEQIEEEKRSSDRLLRNILPEEVAVELQTTGRARPRRFEEVTVLFSDFQDFTVLVESMPPDVLIEELNVLFSRFDDIMLEEGIEKIETIGDAYLAVAGLPDPVPDHALRCVRASKGMHRFLEERNADHPWAWRMRIGLHTGPITTGVVGKTKFSYDVFGDTVNTASRMQTAGEVGRINVSAVTHERIRSEFECEFRGALHAKGKGKLDMYFVR